MIIADADIAMARAIANVLANAARLPCSWQMMKNLENNCTGAIKWRFLDLHRRFKAAAFATFGNASYLDHF